MCIYTSLFQEPRRESPDFQEPRRESPDYIHVAASQVALLNDNVSLYT